MYKGTRTVRMMDGTTFKMTYKELCRSLGFTADTCFVKLTNKGTIGYTLGKPNEIKALYAAVLREGFKPAKSLVAIDKFF